MSLQMIGTRRSGSNLLRVMTGRLPGVYAPQSTHMLEFFMPLVGYYGDLDDKKIFMQLVDDVCRCVELNPVEWAGVRLNRDEVLQRCRDNNLMAIFAAIYLLAAEQNNCNKEWLCKCLGYINYFDELERFFGDELKYVYIYRDGRDVALSFTKAMAGQKHHYFIAKEWARTQRLALSIKDKLPENRFLSVCYESLLHEPEATCQRLADFMGIPFNNDMLKYYESQSAKLSAGASKLWGNITKPLLVNNTKKYLNEPLQDDIRIFESVAGDMLDALGYERLLTEPGESLIFSEYQIREFEALNNMRKQLLISKENPDDVKRRERQKYFVDSVKDRLGCREVEYHGNMMHKVSG